MEKFLTLKELADKTNVKVDALIDLAAKGHFPVFIAANNWYAHIWRKPNHTENTLENYETISFGDSVRETPKDNPVHLNNSLIRLKNSSLVAHLLNDIVNVGTFEARDSIQAPEEFCFEFRLCDPNDFSKPYEIDLKMHKLVVMAYSLPTINKLLQNEPALAEAELTVNEKKKLLKIIGALTYLISQSASKYNKNGEPNVSAISESIGIMFEKIKVEKKDLNDNGVKDSTRREVMSQGVDALKI